jgi:hypothetical protein
MYTGQQLQGYAAQQPQFTPLPISGALQGVDQGLVDRAAAAWGYVVPGGRIEVSTGVSDHSPTNHAPGHAIDFRVVRPDGSVVRWNDPETLAAARIGRSMGVLGIGAGQEYMGGTHFHWDVSANGARTWSDSGANQSPVGFGQAEYASLISAATGAPLESILAEYNIAPGQTPNFAPIGSPAQGVANAPMGGTPQIPGQPPQIPGQPPQGTAPQGSQNALAMMGQEQEQPFRTNQNSLDPRMFMSRRRFEVIPNEVV